MMDAQLTIDRILDRAVTLFPDREVVTARPDGSRHRYTYADAGDRIAYLAQAFPSWWLPDDYLIRDAIPRTSTGKFDKKTLREQLDAEDVALERSPGDA